jgi:hypothetical protein
MSGFSRFGEDELDHFLMSYCFCLWLKSVQGFESFSMAFCDCRPMTWLECGQSRSSFVQYVHYHLAILKKPCWPIMRMRNCENRIRCNSVDIRLENHQKCLARRCDCPKSVCISDTSCLANINELLFSWLGSSFTSLSLLFTSSTMNRHICHSQRFYFTWIINFNDSAYVSSFIVTDCNRTEPTQRGWDNAPITLFGQAWAKSIRAGSPVEE